MDPTFDDGARASVVRVGDPTVVSARRVDLRVLLASLIGRAITLLAFAVSGSFAPTFGLSSALRAWDGGHYLHIVAHGYPSAIPTTIHGPTPLTAAFFPVFPVVIRAVHDVTRLSPTLVGTVLSILAGAATALVFVRLARPHFGAVVAERGAILFAVFPGSVVLTMVYAEGLLLLFTALCLLALVHRRWVLAGALGALATATRPIALALVVSAVWLAYRATTGRDRRGALLAAAMTPVGPLGYFGYLWAHTGSPITWFTVQHLGWNQHIDFGLGFASPLRHPHYFSDPLWIMYIVGFVLLVVIVSPALRGARLPGLLGAYVVGVLLQCLINSGVGPRPRFLLTAFPLLLLPASVWSTRVYRAAVVVSALGLAVASFVYVRPGLVAP